MAGSQSSCSASVYPDGGALADGELPPDERLFEVQVHATGEIATLGRIVGVFALLDVKTHTLQAAYTGDGLRVEARIRAGDRACSLLQARLGALICVLGVRCRRVAGARGSLA